jgi:hypothetical protein
MFKVARLTLIASLAVLVLASVASAKAPQPASKAAVIRAEMIRGDALNKLFGLGRYSSPTPAQLRAIQRRSIAMNRYYGLGQFARPAAPGFDWGDAGIGGAAVLGTVLLAAAGAAVVVRRRQSPVDAV